MTEIVLDPLAELKLSPQAAKQRTEIHLTGKGITQLHPNFQKFVNLESLWLTDNKIRRIENLVPSDYGNNDLDIKDRVHSLGCLRLRYLALSNNQLTSLRGDIGHLRFLEVLLLSNNRLANMEVASQFLRHLTCLKQLDLFGNPLAEEMNYRFFFIFHHPSVEIFDRQRVSPTERATAKDIFGGTTYKPPHIAFGSALPAEAVGVKSTKVSYISPSVAVLETRAAAVRSREQTKVQRQQQREEEELQQEKIRRSKFTPPPPEDGSLEEAHKARQDQETQSSERKRTQRLIETLFERTDITAIEAAFDASRALSFEDCSSIIRMLLGSLPQSCRDEAMCVVRSQEKQVTSADLLALLTKVPPVCTNRIDFLYSKAQQCLQQGGTKEAQAIHVDINFLTEHIKWLRAN
eukprot:TRINITY_DN6226_c0_g1_i2.p1 TRINITY_DN6226_c0_g1~~TRINITY_DN6226_c0_g1_i2.p1  ORF type:complete len:416 (-),score=74.30 TRINITY_DN6226_c0_g1_i2:100-1317(-)